MNPDWKPAADVAALRLRAALYALVRAFFAGRNVLEVETPILSAAGNSDPNIASFSLDADSGPGQSRRWLRTSPEFALKRLLAAGVGDCYERVAVRPVVKLRVQAADRHARRLWKSMCRRC